MANEETLSSAGGSGKGDFAAAAAEGRLWWPNGEEEEEGRDRLIISGGRGTGEIGSREPLFPGFPLSPPVFG